MLEKVSAQNYERCYPKRLKRFFQSKLNYKSYSMLVSDSERAVVGNIPPEIINLFEPDRRGEKIKLFQEVLAKTADASRRESKISKIKKVLTDGLKEIMPEGTQVKFKYVGFGGYKNVYRFGLKDKDGKKIMHDKALLVYTPTYNAVARKSHGPYAEPNSWYYLQKNMGHPMDKTQFTKHYISDLKNEYTLTEFIDKDITKTTDEFNHNLLLGLILSDSHNNPRKRDKVYDIGGLIKVRDVLDDRIAIKYFKKIANKNTSEEREKVAKQLLKLTKNPKTPLRDKIIDALEYYKCLSPWYFSKTSEDIPLRMLGE